MVEPSTIAAGILGGSSLLGSSKGKKSGGGGEGGGEAAELQAAIASNLLSSTRPLRGQLFGGGAGLTPVEQARLDELESIMSLRGPSAFHDPADLAQLNRLRQRAAAVGPGQLLSFLETGALPEALDIPFTATRENLEDQFSVAREQLLSTIPARGGQLNALLAELGTSRARAVGELPLRALPLRESLFNQALQIAAGSPVQAASVLGQAGALEQQRAAQAAANQQAAGQAFGSAGALAAKLALKPRGGGSAGGSGLTEILLP